MELKPHIWMLAACLILVGVGVIAVTGFGASSRSVFWFGFLLLCPAAHFLMMRNMEHSHPHSADQERNHERHGKL